MPADRLHPAESRWTVREVGGVSAAIAGAKPAPTRLTRPIRYGSFRDGIGPATLSRRPEQK
jgi:hypothetical protein